MNGVSMLGSGGRRGLVVKAKDVREFGDKRSTLIRFHARSPLSPRVAIR